MKSSPFKCFTEKSREFLAKNMDKIAGVALSSLLYMLCRRFDIPVSADQLFRNNKYYAEYRPNRTPRCYGGWTVGDDATEQAILSIGESVEGMTYDSDRLCAAKSITELACKSGVSDATRAKAIEVLGDICGEMTYDSDRRKVHELIKKIGMA